jgi:hypothetical protein
MSIPRFEMPLVREEFDRITLREYRWIKKSLTRISEGDTAEVESLLASLERMRGLYYLLRPLEENVFLANDALLGRTASDFVTLASTSVIHRTLKFLVRNSLELLDFQEVCDLLGETGPSGLGNPTHRAFLVASEAAIDRIRQHIHRDRHRSPSQFSTADLFAGITQTYREASLRFYTAFSSRLETDFDAWRRYVGYHGHQLQYLDIRYPDIQARSRDVLALFGNLNWDRDLLVVRRLLDIRETLCRPLRDRIEDERQLVRLQAESAAEALFADECKQLIAGLRERWENHWLRPGERGGRGKIFSGV